MSANVGMTGVWWSLMCRSVSLNFCFKLAAVVLLAIEKNPIYTNCFFFE